MPDRPPKPPKRRPSDNIRADVGTIDKLRKIAAFQYPGLTLVEVLGKLLEPGMAKHEAMLARIEELEKAHPGLSVEELRTLALAEGLAALTSKPAK